MILLSAFANVSGSFWLKKIAMLDEESSIAQLGLLFAFSGVSYVAAFGFYAAALKHLPLSIAYAAITGSAAIGVSVMGIILFEEAFTPLVLLGLSLIILGIVVLFSIA